MSVDHNSSTRAKDKGNIFDHDADIDPVKQLATSESEVKRLKVRQHELRAEIAMLQQDIISKDRSRAENSQEGEELEQRTGSDQQSLRRHSARERRRERAMRRKVAMNQMAMREETMRQMAALTLET